MNRFYYIMSFFVAYSCLEKIQGTEEKLMLCLLVLDGFDLKKTVKDFNFKVR